MIIQVENAVAWLSPFSVLVSPLLISMLNVTCHDNLIPHVPMGKNRLTMFVIFPQPRGTCYVASEGLPQLVYSGYQPHAYSWDEFPPLKDILML